MARPATADVFRAIADPTRRGLLDCLLAGEQPVTRLAGSFAIGLPAVSQHLKVLREVGLVSEHRDGRQRLYSVNAGPLREVSDWIAHYERFWHEKLDALERHLRGEAMKRDIRIERFYAYPPERVFRALTDPAAMGDWLMKNDFQPKLGHKFQFRAKPQGSWSGIVDCEVTEFDPPRRVAYTWMGQDTKPTGKPKIATTVAWTLTAENGGTRLRLDHNGFQGFGEVLISFILSSGWKRMMKARFAAAIEQVKESSYFGGTWFGTGVSELISANLPTAPTAPAN